MTPKHLSYDGGCGDPKCDLCAADAEAAFKRHALTSGLYRCSCCGEAKTADVDSRWRWNGKNWEHSHGQEGHYEARYFGTLEEHEEKYRWRESPLLAPHADA